MKKSVIRLLSASALCAASGLGLGSAPAEAAACTAASPVATIPLIRDSEGRSFFVRVAVNGSNKLMMLSTANGTTTFLTEAVEAMNLPVTNLRGATMATSVGTRGYDVAAAQLSLGNARLVPNIYLLYPPQADGATLYKANIVGWLGLDVLTQYDFDLNLAANTLTLYDNKTCSGEPRPGAQAVSFDYDTKGRIVVPVTLDGYPLRAALDTSADNDALNLRIAQDSMNFNTAAPGVEKVPDTGAVDTYRARFKTFTMGGVTVNNPTLMVIQDKLRNQVEAIPATGTNIRPTEDNRMPDFLISNKLMSQYHVYVASREHKLYITPAGR
jgi:predicted aspartyl protease